jgi:hypothetical protein
MFSWNICVHPRFLVGFVFLDLQFSVNHYLSFSLFLFLLAIVLSVDLRIQIIPFGIFKLFLLFVYVNIFPVINRGKILLNI